jgi:hypothetical protein
MAVSSSFAQEQIILSWTCKAPQFRHKYLITIGSVSSDAQPKGMIYKNSGGAFSVSIPVLDDWIPLTFGTGNNSSTIATGDGFRLTIFAEPEKNGTPNTYRAVMRTTHLTIGHTPLALPFSCTKVVGIE